VYIALLELGPSKAGTLIKFTAIQNSVMHLTLGKLSAQGFVSYIRRGKIKIFQAAEPQSLLRLVDERRQRLQAVLPQLEALRNKAQMPEAEIYEGMHGLRNMCFKLIENTKKGDNFLFFGFSCSNSQWEQQVYQFYREYTFIRLDRGLKIRGIAHESMKPRFIEHSWPHTNIRFVPFPTLRNMSICNNRVIIVPWEETQTSFLITSNSFAQNCLDYFNEVWGTTRGKDSAKASKFRSQPAKKGNPR
jgi:hypothetical protein